MVIGISGMQFGLYIASDYQNRTIADQESDCLAYNEYDYRQK